MLPKNTSASKLGFILDSSFLCRNIIDKMYYSVIVILNHSKEHNSKKFYGYSGKVRQFSIGMMLKNRLMHVYQKVLKVHSATENLSNFTLCYVQSYLKHVLCLFKHLLLPGSNKC